MLLCKKIVYFSALLIIILILGIVIQLFSSSVVASCENKAGFRIQLKANDNLHYKSALKKITLKKKTISNLDTRPKSNAMFCKKEVLKM